MKKQKQTAKKCAALKGWKGIKPAGITEPASAVELKTGEWRSQRPVHLPDKCIHCLQCFIYCPDVAIKVEQGKFKEIDYHHCKGCGICAAICPAQAIKMVNESEAREKEKKKK